MKSRTAKRLIAVAIIAAVLAIVLIVRSFVPPEYEITDLGYIKGQGFAVAINNEGRVVGWIHAPVPAARPTAFIWSPRKGRRSIPAFDGKVSAAYDINDKGQIVGYFGELANDKGPARAFIWDEETGLTELGSLGNGSHARAVNNKGQVVGYSRTPAGQSHAFIWDKTNGMRDLGTLGGRSSFAVDINEKGQVVGHSHKPNGQMHAFVWQQDTGMVDIGTLGGPYSRATSIDNSGQVVGVSAKNGAETSFIWELNSGLSDLGVPGQTGLALRINDSGRIVGYYFTPRFLIFRERHSVLLWDPDRGDVELNLGSENVNLVLALDINNKGQVLATFRVSQQEHRVVILTPKTSRQPKNSKP